MPVPGPSLALSQGTSWKAMECPPAPTSPWEGTAPSHLLRAGARPALCHAHRGRQRAAVPCPAPSGKGVGAEGLGFLGHPGQLGLGAIALWGGRLGLLRDALLAPPAAPRPGRRPAQVGRSRGWLGRGVQGPPRRGGGRRLGARRSQGSTGRLARIRRKRLGARPSPATTPPDA